MPRLETVEKYKGSTWEIVLDDGEHVYLNADIVSRFSLSAGMELCDEEWDEIVAENLYRKARERALYLLDYKDYSYIELYKKLEKTYPEDICGRVMDKLTEIGVINDRRYAEGLARTYVESRCYGYYKAMQTLRQRGITKQIAEEVLETYEDGAYDRLREFAEKKYSSYLDDEAGIRKVKSALVRRGFSYDLVNRVVRDIIEDADG
ncbi:MAG: regulatory protein RecX [Ruminococcus sp.]|nr:regulatory protein RecX [Ruminococcus sp.]